MAIEGLLSGALGVAFLVQERPTSRSATGSGIPQYVARAVAAAQSEDIVIGAPALGSGQVLEARRLRHEDGPAVSQQNAEEQRAAGE